MCIRDRNKIRAWFKKERREENIAEGKLQLEAEFKRNYISLPEKQMIEFIINLAKRQNYDSMDDFFAAIGYGGVRLSRIIPRVKDDYQKLIRPAGQTEVLIPHTTKSSNGVIVEGIDNCLIKFAQCCNPLPGDRCV